MKKEELRNKMSRKRLQTMRDCPELRSEMVEQERRCADLAEEDAETMKNEVQKNPYFGLQRDKPGMQSITY